MKLLLTSLLMLFIVSFTLVGCDTKIAVSDNGDGTYDVTIDAEGIWDQSRWGLSTWQQ